MQSIHSTLVVQHVQLVGVRSQQHRMSEGAVSIIDAAAGLKHTPDNSSFIWGMNPKKRGFETEVQFVHARATQVRLSVIIEVYEQLRCGKTWRFKQRTADKMPRSHSSPQTEISKISLSHCFVRCAQKISSDISPVKQKSIKSIFVFLLFAFWLEVGSGKVSVRMTNSVIEQEKQKIKDLADLAKRPDDCCPLFRPPGLAIKSLTQLLAVAGAHDSQVCIITALRLHMEAAHHIWLLNITESHLGHSSWKRPDKLKSERYVKLGRGWGVRQCGRNHHHGNKLKQRIGFFHF